MISSANLHLVTAAMHAPSDVWDPLVDANKHFACSIAQSSAIDTAQAVDMRVESDLGHAASDNLLILMIRYMFSDQPFTEVARTPGESVKRELTTTSLTYRRALLMSFVKGSYSALSSSNFSLSSSSSSSKPS